MLQGQANIIQAAYINNVKKLLFLGSSCIYPKLAEQPMTESALLTGLLEPTNEPYAIAKIAGMKTAVPEALKKARVGDGLAIQVFGPGQRDGYFGLGFGDHLPEQNGELVNMEFPTEIVEEIDC